jgi:hypothetical protein
MLIPPNRDVRISNPHLGRYLKKRRAWAVALADCVRFQLPDTFYSGPMPEAESGAGVRPWRRRISAIFAPVRRTTGRRVERSIRLGLTGTSERKVDQPKVYLWRSGSGTDLLVAQA